MIHSGAKSKIGNQNRVQPRLPILVIVFSSLAGLFLIIPILALLQRAPWSEMTSLLSDSAAIEALRLSLVCSLGATFIALITGVPLAWVLARTDFRGRRLLRALVILPLILPPVAGGVALLLAFGRRGLVGEYLSDWFGLQLPFTTLGAMLAATFVALPFLVITVEAGFRSIDRSYEDAARTLGAKPSFIFRRITFPLLAPSIVAGAVLAWARALGEFGATITFAGSVAGRTQTLPLAVFFDLGFDPERAIALSVVLVIISIGVLVSLRERWLTPLR